MEFQMYNFEQTLINLDNEESLLSPQENSKDSIQQYQQQYIYNKSNSNDYNFYDNYNENQNKSTVDIRSNNQSNESFSFIDLIELFEKDKQNSKQQVQISCNPQLIESQSTTDSYSAQKNVKKMNNINNNRKRNNKKIIKDGYKQPNTSHVLYNMVYQLFPYLIKIYQQKIPCLCIKNEQICKRCQELNMLIEIKLGRNKSKQSFEKIWDNNKRMRILSEQFFLYNAPISIKSHVYRQQSYQDIIYKSLPSFLEGAKGLQFQSIKKSSFI